MNCDACMRVLAFWFNGGSQRRAPTPLGRDSQPERPCVSRLCPFHPHPLLHCLLQADGTRAGRAAPELAVHVKVAAHAVVSEVVDAVAAGLLAVMAAAGEAPRDGDGAPTPASDGAGGMSGGSLSGQRELNPAKPQSMGPGCLAGVGEETPGRGGYHAAG
jgi:hypothetical protein